MIVNCLQKPERRSKQFDQQVARRTNDLYKARFGVGVPRRFVHGAGVSHVLWVESDEQETLGATMLSSREEGVYKIRGIAVREDREGQGVGTALMDAVDRAVGKGSTVWLCVDTGKPQTPWLLVWYAKLGFKLAEEDPRFPHTEDEIPMSKVIE